MLSHIFGIVNPNVLSIIVITQTSDICQYFAGRLFGYHKNIVSISPGKSLEGYVVGAGGCSLLFYYLGYYKAPLIVIMGVMGDLLVSYVKRKLRIKHSSPLLMEHGGWLDRIDSTMLALWVF
jgi:phosphatidate cytidylyltransferase